MDVFVSQERVEDHSPEKEAKVARQVCQGILKLRYPSVVCQVVVEIVCELRNEDAKYDEEEDCPMKLLNLEPSLYVSEILSDSIHESHIDDELGAAFK